MNPRRADVTPATLARLIGWTLVGLNAALLLRYPELFVWVLVVGGFLACAVWIVRLHEQRDEANASWADQVFASAGHKARADALNKENTRLHLLLTEAEHRAACCDQPLEPGLHVVPQRSGEHDDLPVADVDIPVHTDIVDDVWLELLITRPAEES